jgi:hypothetical protein
MCGPPSAISACVMAMQCPCSGPWLLLLLLMEEQDGKRRAFAVGWTPAGHSVHRVPRLLRIDLLDPQLACNCDALNQAVVSLTIMAETPCQFC